MPHLLGLTHERPARPRLERTHALEHRDHVQPDDAVWILTDVELELAHRPVGVHAVHAVLAAGVEAERVEFALQSSHVVAAEMRGVQVEGAVTEVVPGLHELAPGIGAHETVDPQGSSTLELAHGGVGRRPEAGAGFARRRSHDRAG